ncbi:MAG: glycosyltransferase family 2 protein [Candidatus Nanoarchaeia archaeon]|nr:glycosyltransferase family 2 protein [Candidatus Nanoarchaeia archaeon]
MEDNLTLKLDNLKKRVLDFKVKTLYGEENINLKNDEVIVLCLVKNGEIYIEEFVKHYFKLGVKHIVFLDNGSSDKTIEYSSKFNNITILQTEFPFRNTNEMRMRDYLIERFAKNHWSLCVDIDEFFDYPFSDKIPLNKLIEYLNENSYTAVVCHMLDMFPFSISRYSEKQFIRKNHKYYDLSAIKKIDYYFDNGRIFKGNIKIYLGGIRNILFGIDSFLIKHALLFKNEQTVRSRLGHTLINGKIADFTAVLFHYKFTRDFFYYVEDAFNREYHYKNSSDHKFYYKILSKKENLVIKQDTSVRFKNMRELLDNNFLIVSQQFRNFSEKKNSPNI